jgi:ABC-2 type transport system ATP-binding protein
VNVLPAAIETQGLGRDYGEIRALDALTIAVPSGGLVALLGPNGAGKTTAMLLLATLLTPSRGSARVLGHDLRRERNAIRRRLGLVFQEPTIDGLLTVEENLVFAARLAGLRGARRRAAVSEALDRTRLAHRSRQAAGTLSGGLRRLTDVARATLHAPDLLLLDEPTVGLDPEHRRSTWEFIDGERRTRGVTVLFSTHYLAEAERADHVIMLSHGRVVADDTPQVLRAAIGPAATLEDVYFARALAEDGGASPSPPRTEKALQ